MIVATRLLFSKNYTVSDVIQDGCWTILENIQQQFPVLTKEIMEVHNLSDEEDEVVWCGSDNGEIMVKKAFHFCREKAQVVKWKRNIWQPFIAPKVSIYSWKVLNSKLTTGSVFHQWGLLPSLVCIGCIYGVP